MSGAKRTLLAMPETLISYARCFTDEQDLTVQQQRLTELGVSPDRIYLDHGLLVHLEYDPIRGHQAEHGQPSRPVHTEPVTESTEPDET